MRGAAISLAIFLTTGVSAIAGEISIASPDHAQTYAYGGMISRQLYPDRAGGELAARITFSNLPYADENDPRRDESFDFRFPGVRFDSAQRAFFARGLRGEPIVVAKFRGDAAWGWINLASGAKVYLVKEHGRVTATLTATDYPRGGSRWVELDNNWSLQNLLIALFAESRWRPGS